MDKSIYVGVMGYSSQKFDVNRANAYLSQAFDLIKIEFPNQPIVIVSGYTNLGIPALAYAEAVHRGWKTAGVACSKAKNYECFPCDEIHIIGENWGDESSSFLNMCQIFIRVGGGRQSLREATQAKVDKKPVYEYELEAQP